MRPFCVQAGNLYAKPPHVPEDGQANADPLRTASLDVESETRVQEALSRLIVGKTVLIIAHRMRTVEAADKVVVLEAGRVVEQGTPEELRARPGGLFAHMTELQQASAAWQA